MAEQGAGSAGEGTGAGTQPQGQGSGLHEQFISSAPEHLRDAARELVPTWDQYVQRQFTDNADYRKQWEPYEELGVNQLDPSELNDLLEFRNIIQDEDQFREWYENIGEMMGFSGQENGDNQYDLDNEFADPAIKQMSEQMGQMQQMMQGLMQERQEQAQQQVLQQTAMEVRGELDALKKDNPNLTEEDEDIICTFALKYDSSDAITRGFQDYQKLMGRAENGVFNQKTDPSLRVAPVSGGSNNTAPEPVITFEQAARAARERLRQTPT